MKITPRLLAFGLLALVTGCTQRITDFTLMSGKNIDVAALGKARHMSQRVRGKDVGHIFLCIPLKVPNVKDAMDNGMEQAPGSIALVDGVVYSQSFWVIPLIYGQNNYIVEGNPLFNSPSSPAPRK